MLHAVPSLLDSLHFHPGCREPERLQPAQSAPTLQLAPQLVKQLAQFPVSYLQSSCPYSRIKLFKIQNQNIRRIEMVQIFQSEIINK